ncbi:MAG: hypothetical protein ACK2TS_07880 [Anaerolineales bacterium]
MGRYLHNLDILTNIDDFIVLLRNPGGNDRTHGTSGTKIAVIDQESSKIILPYGKEIDKCNRLGLKTDLLDQSNASRNCPDF